METNRLIARFFKHSTFSLISDLQAAICTKIIPHRGTLMRVQQSINTCRVSQQVSIQGAVIRLRWQYTKVITTDAYQNAYVIIKGAKARHLLTDEARPGSHERPETINL